MNESANSERLSDIDIRSHAGIVRSPLDEIKAIQTLLADVYKDAGDGRTLFRELVQNADDAGARRLRFTVLERGWPHADNSLLRGPALLVANDGPFSDKDREGLHKAIGGSKEEDVHKIGTFGIGLKSVFHICEAFLYIGAAQAVWRAGVLNPWAGTGESGARDPLHPDWDTVGKRDVERLRGAMTELLGETDNGLLLWIPLRCNEHLDRRADGYRFGLGDHCPRSQELCSWFGCSTPAALLLAQCGHLQTIDTKRAAKPENLGDSVMLMHVARQTVGWLGRYQNEDRQCSERPFEGTITSQASKWSVVGVEALDDRRLRDLRSQPDWPQSPNWRNGRYATVPRKALAHAAVTVLRPVDHDADQLGKLGTRLRWAVFLPLDDDPVSSSSAIVESDGPSPAWEIILHGYFWPSQDRKSIPGVTGEYGDVTSDGDIRNRWNRALCEELLLPLLPSALAKAVDSVDEGLAQELLERVVCSDLVKHRMPCVTRRHWLLPVVAPNRVHWRALDAEVCQVLSIPNWNQAPEAIRTCFLASSRERTSDAVFIDNAAPRFAGKLDDWTINHLECLLNSVQGDAFACKQSLQWIAEVVTHVLGPDACPEDIRATAFVRWIVGRIAGGALRPTIRQSTSPEIRDELRDAWSSLCAPIPRAWLVETPVDTLQAVSELTKCDGVIGEGLFLLPVGRRQGNSRLSLNLDKDRLDCALAALGQRLEEGGESARLRHSRLVLAETLLSVRPNCPIDDHLRGLPFLRTIRLPDDKEDAWSIADLRRQIESHRVFADPISEVLGYDSTNGTQPERTLDPKRAVKDLAMALDETAWLVSGDAMASVAADVPSPTPEALARAVLQAETFAEVASRTPLLRRLASNISEDTHVRFAARALLAGRVVEDDTELLQVHARSERALLILLHLLGQSWCALNKQLVGSFSQDFLEALSVSHADLETLHRLLGDCLDRRVDWTGLSDEEALHLLQYLHSTEPEAQQRWCRMPLHRDVDGDRGELDDHAWRSTERTSNIELPKEIRAGLRLLDPDSDVAHLYYIVPELGPDGVLQLMLEASSPWRFAKWIVQHMRSNDGRVTLPRGSFLRDLLKTSCWLPGRDGKGLAPEAVLIAPKEVLDVVHDLDGAFGDKRLPDAVHPQIWQMAESAVREIQGRMGRGRQVERLANALVSDRVAQIDGGTWLVMPEARLVDASLIDNALETTLVGSHPGWKLVHTVNRVLRHGDSQSTEDPKLPLLKLAESLCASVPLEHQIKMLALLAATRPAKESPGRYMFKRLLGCFAETNGFFDHVLPRLNLPTQDGNWHSSRDVARTETGVARRHLLDSELRSILELNGEDRPPQPMSGGYDPNESVVETLRLYFKPWRDRLPHGAVGALLSLLGSGSRGEIAKLIEEWLGEDVSIEGMRDKLVGPNGEDPCASVIVWVFPRVAQGNRALAVNVVGEWVEMEAEPDNSTLFAIDPERYPGSRLGIAPDEPFWEIRLRDVNPQSRTSSELLRLLGNTVERWATKYLKLDRERVNAWWSEWGGSSKADLRPVLASIKAHLPLTLQQLDVRESETLRNALRAAERAQRKREQMPSDQSTIRIERDSLDHLEELIREPKHQEFLWSRVNELMRRYGYRNDSVLLELAQNADDALAQVAEIKGGSVPRSTCRFLVRVHENGGEPTLDVMHWGRPINDTGGAAFPAGRNRQWDQDLYYMMLMNLSGKPGEVPGEASLSSTTGRFGLGFKSVHLLSPSPSVVSGFIAFSIVGGLLPQEQAVPDSTDPWMTEGPRGTRIRLPLRRDVEADKLIQSLFDRFSYARALLPVFAREVREVIVEGGPFPGVHVFDGKPIEGATAWSIGDETELPNHGSPWRILRFRPAGSGLTAALAVGLRDGVPTVFNPDMPFLWNVTPTSEEWACGYVVNGPFKLDPGRTHVSLDDDTTLQAVRGLGNELGKGLIELHDVLTGIAKAEPNPILGSDGQSFLSSLWEVLASGMDNSDKLRQSFLRQLHGTGRGISAWMAARSAIPTDLPAPFPPLLPPQSSELSWEVATDGLDNPELCAALAEIDDEDFRALVGSRRIVSRATNRRLCALMDTDGNPINPTPLRPANFLAALAKRWDYLLTPTRLHALRPFSRDTVWNLVSNDPYGITWAGGFRARSAVGSCQLLQELLLRETSAIRDEADRVLDEELLRSAFAPDDRLLDSKYIGHPEDWIVFRRLRGQHRIGANEIANWYQNVTETLQPAALRYLVYGELQGRVLSRLISLETRPSWLRDYDNVRQMLEGICEEPWRCQRLLGALFPDQFAPEPSRQLVQSYSDTFFNRLSEWWDDAAVRSEVTTDYERQVWPDWLRRDHDIADRLQSGSKDHWLALLVLGACRSFGRTRASQHRTFLERAHKQGWWDIFQAPKEVGAWMEMLRDWQDGAMAKLEDPQWMSLFPAIYQLSRYRDVYVRLLKSAGQRPNNGYDINRLFAPRVDEALTGAGTHFDAPPAPLDMGRHWVLRELVRLKVVEGERLYRDCWVPSEQVIRFLCDLGFDRPDDRICNKEKAHAIFGFLASELETATPNLHLAFDIPIRHVAEDSDLRLQFGLVQ